MARRGWLDGAALAAAREAVQALPVARTPIAQLDALQARLQAEHDPALRLLALTVLATVARPDNGQGWTAERRARLQTFALDASHLVAGAAEGPPAQPVTAHPPFSSQQSSWCGASQVPQKTMLSRSLSGKRQNGQARPVSDFPAVPRRDPFSSELT